MSVNKMKDYFEDWSKVINFEELIPIVKKLSGMYNSSIKVTPSQNDVFKAFKSCKYKDLKVVMIGQGPYPQEGVATGLAFANKDSKVLNISPSLDIIIESIERDCRIPFPIVDITLEKWAEQGILLLNSALTVEVNKPGSHTMLWRPFITSLLTNLSEINSGIIYVLFGNTAKTFKPYINKNSNYIIECNYPAYYARNNTVSGYTIWTDINKILKQNHNLKINFYE